MIILSWQDKISIISLIIGVVSLGITIWSLKNTGLIKKAVNKTHQELMNKFKFATHRNTYLDNINKIKDEVSKIEGFRLSSDKLKEISIKIEAIVKWLSDCNAHFSDKDKEKVNEIINHLSETNKSESYIFDDHSQDELRSFCMELSFMLSKEDYYL